MNKQAVLAVLLLSICSSLRAQDCGCKEDFSSKCSFATYLQFKDGGDLVPLLVEDRGGRAVSDGHVILGSAKAWRDFGTRLRSKPLASSELARMLTLGPLGALHGQRKWSEGVVPYVLPTGADKLTDAQKKAFDMAVACWCAGRDRRDPRLPSLKGFPVSRL